MTYSPAVEAINWLIDVMAIGAIGAAIYLIWFGAFCWWTGKKWV